MSFALSGAQPSQPRVASSDLASDADAAAAAAGAAAAAAAGLAASAAWTSAPAPITVATANRAETDMRGRDMGGSFPETGPLPKTGAPRTSAAAQAATSMVPDAITC